MKGTQEQWLSLISALAAGNAEVVDNESDSDFDLSSATSLIHSSVETILRPTLETELTESIKKEIAGLSGGTLRTTLGQLTGIDKNLLKDLKDKEAIKLAMEHYGKSIGADKEDVLKLVEKANQDKDTEWGEKYTALEQEKESWRSKYIDRDILSALTKELENAPIPKTANREVIARDLKRELGDNYIIQYDEDKGALGLFMKDKPTIPAHVDNVPVKVFDLAKGFLEPRGLWEKDMRNENPAIPTNNNGQNYVPDSGMHRVEQGTPQEWSQALKAHAERQGVTQ